MSDRFKTEKAFDEQFSVVRGSRVLAFNLSSSFPAEVRGDVYLLRRAVLGFVAQQTEELCAQLVEANRRLEEIARYAHDREIMCNQQAQMNAHDRSITTWRLLTLSKSDEFGRIAALALKKELVTE